MRSKIVVVVVLLVAKFTIQAQAQLNAVQNGLQNSRAYHAEHTAAQDVYENRSEAAVYTLEHYASENVAFDLATMQRQLIAASCSAYLENGNNTNNNFFSSSVQQQSYWQQASTFFYDKDYEKAISTYLQVDNNLLTNLQIVEKNFNLAYSYLMSNRESEVLPLMASVVNIKGNYFESGNYYYGLLQFYNGKYEEARQSFEKIKNDKQYKKVVPYYFAAIAYYKQDKAQALALAEASLADADAQLYYRDELNLLAGQVLFEQKQYEKALPYIEYYMAESSNLKREDLFLYGFTCYQLGSHSKAIDVLGKVQEELDTLTQMSNYVIADCHLKNNNKEEAKDAFQRVLNVDGIATINEVSRYQFTKLSYEMSIDDDALNGAYNLVKKFPNSKYKPDCMKILSSLLQTTTNYESALSLLSTFQLDANTGSAYQLLAYNKAIKEMNAGNADSATKYFNTSLKQPLHADVKANALFWLADLAYEKKMYNAADSLATLYIACNATESGDANLNNAYLIKTYCAIKQGHDSSATNSLNKIFLSKNDIYLLTNAIELNNINNTLEQHYILEKRKDIVLDSLQAVQDKPSKLATADSNVSKLLSAMQEQNLNPAQQAKLQELLIVQEVLGGKAQAAIESVKSIAKPLSSRLQFYCIKAYEGVKDSVQCKVLAAQHLSLIDSNDEWQARTVVQQFDAAYTAKNKEEASKYLLLLKQFTMQYAKMRVPIKSNLLDLLSDTTRQKKIEAQLQQKANTLLKDSVSTQQQVIVDSAEKAILPQPTQIKTNKTKKQKTK